MFMVISIFIHRFFLSGQRSGLSQTNLAARPSVAIREALLKTGESDCLLFAGGKPIANLKAKL
jgi:hypothetical protein